MKKLCGVVSSMFILALFVFAMTSCNQRTSGGGGGGSSSGGGGSAGGGKNAKSIIGSTYGCDKVKEDGGISKNARIIKFVSDHEWVLQVKIDVYNTYENVFKGTYVMRDNKILLIITWQAPVISQSLLGKTVVVNIVNDRQFTLLEDVWNKI